MSVFAISDLHLDVSANDKSMEVFGNKWLHYTEKIKNNWTRLITEKDTVIIPGDISWALNIEESLPDLKWIDALPGKKIFLKGNHDFWWSTISKMRKILNDNQITSIEFLYNSALEVENYIIAGSRGWFVDKSIQSQKNINADHEKILNREVIRLKLSLDVAKKLALEHEDKEIIVFLHFPPIWGDFECSEILNLLKEYNVKRCFFGHIHGCYNQSATFLWEDIKFEMISADFIDFIPRIV